MSETDFERHEPEATVVEVIKNALGKFMGLSVDEGDINEFIEELQELQM